MELFEHKIIYYETSRGCPFSCSYCLSSIDKCLRFRDLELVKKELQLFIDHKVPQVKFVDRTFNCKHDHAMTVWRYIKEHDNGITNFHFEVAADLLNEEEMELIKTMRPGLIQLEIGVQSTNLDTIREIHRTMKFEQVAEVVRRINSYGNVHQHLDLIAGLPYEDYESFGKSFDEVYALEPEQLQLGFLKVLKGSYMEEKKDDYGLVYKGMPPYEVLYTKWLPYEDTLRLKGIEEMVETYYNSRQFCYTLPYLIRHFKRPFTLFEKLAEYYEENGLDTLSHARTARYEILYDFARFYDAERCEAYKQLLTLDFYLRENAKSRPLFAGDERISKEEFRLFLQPKRDLASGEIASAEALVRWIREDGSVIFPDQFIPLFELNGFCAQLDLYMVAQVCRKLRQWEDEGRRPISVSVNQSKLLFYQSDYVERLCQITEHYNIPRSRITLEILEGLAAESIGELNKTIMLLKNLGFKISLDDFGSGYSSLNLLTRMGIDEVKLDRGFLEQEVFRESESQAVLMKHIVNLARDLSITTVVEGVETAENEAFIRSIGVDYGQGYYYSRPIPSDEFAEKYLQ